jgi:hypothetical protein
MRILTPEDVIQRYPYTLCLKYASTRIKIIDETDIAREASFLDLEGRTHEVKLGRCICIGSQGERWTCSVESLKRDRYPVSESDAQGYRDYKMKQSQSVHCFDLPFPFTLLHKGEWLCEESSGGIITWNGQHGEALDMRVVRRGVFTATYQAILLSLDHQFERLKAVLAQEQNAGSSNSLDALLDHQCRRDALDRSRQAIQAILQPVLQAIEQLPALPDIKEIHWAQSLLLMHSLAFMELDSTGLAPDDELVRFTLIDGQGKTIDDFLIRPISRVLTKAVSAINGIDPELLEREGLGLSVAWERIKRAVIGRYVISYGLDWDLNLLSRVATRHTLTPLTIIGNDLQRHCTHYYQGDYALKLSELCERVGVPLPPQPGQTALHRANGQLAVLAGIATGVIDVRPGTTAASTIGANLSDDTDDEHPF